MDKNFYQRLGAVVTLLRQDLIKIFKVTFSYNAIQNENIISMTALDKFIIHVYNIPL